MNNRAPNSSNDPIAAFPQPLGPKSTSDAEVVSSCPATVPLDNDGRAPIVSTPVKRDSAAYQIYLQTEFATEEEARALRTEGLREGILQNMLCSQMSLAHDLVKSFLLRAGGEPSIVEAARLANAAARLMGMFQQGMTALHSIQRSNDQQPPTAQQVNVSGGNVLVAANVQTGGGSRTRGEN